MLFRVRVIAYKFTMDTHRHTHTHTYIHTYIHIYKIKVSMAPKEIFLTPPLASIHYVMTHKTIHIYYLNKSHGSLNMLYY